MSMNYFELISLSLLGYAPVSRAYVNVFLYLMFIKKYYLTVSLINLLLRLVLFICKVLIHFNLSKSYVFQY